MLSWYFSTSAKKIPAKQVWLFTITASQSDKLYLWAVYSEGGEPPSTVFCLGGGGRGDGNTFKKPKGGKPLLAKAILSMLARQAAQLGSSSAQTCALPFSF